MARLTRDGAGAASAFQGAAAGWARRGATGAAAVIVAVALATLPGAARAEEATADEQATTTDADGRAALPAGARVTTLAELAWPATTRSAVARGATYVWAAPSRRVRLGRLARGTRIAVDVIAATGKPPAAKPGRRRKPAATTGCWAWLRIEPAGWVCSGEVTPSDEPPAPATRAATPTGGYVTVGPRGARAYASLDDAAGARAATAGHAAAHDAASRDDATPGLHATTGAAAGSHAAATELAAGTPLTTTAAQLAPDGVRYHATDRGWVAATELRWQAPSPFVGLAVDAAPAWPFAWTLGRRGSTIRVHRTPGGAKIDRLPRRTVVPVLERRRGWVRIGEDAWVRAEQVGVAAPSPRPTGVGADERWLDVDLDQQVLVSYEGDRPVFATLVSTGKEKAYRTPLGTFRLGRKQASARMRSPEGARQDWDVENVPWVMHFKKLFALHGAHWHDAYGRKVSHGCVNLSPRDAGQLFRWTSPVVPDGWADIEGGTGTVIRIRSHARPDPPWRDFEGDVIAPPR